MFLQELKINNFRKIGRGGPVSIPFDKGVNLIVGGDDAGKSALVDALRFCLGTRGLYYDRISPTDFYCENGVQKTEFSIHCIFADLSDQEQTELLEWTTITPAFAGAASHVELEVRLSAKLQRDGSVYSERRARPGANEKEVDGKLREFLPATYLRPLRDASSELRPGRNCRLAQILRALPAMLAEKSMDSPKSLASIMKQSQDKIADNETIKNIEKRLLDDFLSEATLHGLPMKPRLGMGTDLSFEHVIERLELSLDPPDGITTKVGRGLGLDNILFMCAEMLLLQSEAVKQLPILLVRGARGPFASTNASKRRNDAGKSNKQR